MFRRQKWKQLLQLLQQRFPSNGKRLHDKVWQCMVLKQSYIKDKIILILIQIFIPAFPQDGVLFDKTALLIISCLKRLTQRDIKVLTMVLIKNHVF
jgi:hypothetical protein